MEGDVIPGITLFNCVLHRVKIIVDREHTSGVKDTATGYILILN